MSIRNRLAAVAAVVAALAIAAPVAGASAAPGKPGKNARMAQAPIPCYPYPAFCGPGGQPWFSPPGWLLNLPGFNLQGFNLQGLFPTFGAPIR